jgi:hypothetical protein
MFKLPSRDLTYCNLEVAAFATGGLDLRAAVVIRRLRTCGPEPDAATDTPIVVTVVCRCL